MANLIEKYPLNIVIGNDPSSSQNLAWPVARELAVAKICASKKRTASSTSQREQQQGTGHSAFILDPYSNQYVAVKPEITYFELQNLAKRAGLSEFEVLYIHARGLV